MVRFAGNLPSREGHPQGGAKSQDSLGVLGPEAKRHALRSVADFCVWVRPGGFTGQQCGMKGRWPASNGQSCRALGVPRAE